MAGTVQRVCSWQEKGKPKKFWRKARPGRGAGVRIMGALLQEEHVVLKPENSVMGTGLAKRPQAVHSWF